MVHRFGCDVFRSHAKTYQAFKTFFGKLIQDVVNEQAMTQVIEYFTNKQPREVLA